MQLDNTSNIPDISKQTGFSIFELPKGDFAEILPKSIHAHPNEKGYYSVDEIREIFNLVRNKQEQDIIIVFEDAELINTSGINAFLKNLEEPNQHIHIVFLVRKASEIIPTVMSRASYYYLPNFEKIDSPIDAEQDIIKLAKQYISATPQQLPKIASDIAKDKNDSRAKALRVVDVAIQILYKSYFITGNQAFLKKLDSLIKTSEALRTNGHVKLQLVANMV